MPQLAAEEQDSLVLAALFGALDDLTDEYQQTDRVRSDAEILEVVQGIYQVGSEYYGGELGRTMELFEQFAARLGQMACFHDHFSQNVLSVANELRPSYHDLHDHEEENEDGPYGKKKRKKKAHGTGK